MNSNKWAKSRRKTLKAIFGGKCANCGSGARLEFHHIKPTELSGRGRGRKERLCDISQHRDSYLLLCHSCHKGVST